MFYLVLPSLEMRSVLIAHLKSKGILAVFHYLSLHQSSFYNGKHDGRKLLNCDRFADTLLRLPLFYELKTEPVNTILDEIRQWDLLSS